jgi:hypothetical protein
MLRISGAEGSETSVQVAKFELKRYGTDDGLGWGTPRCVLRWEVGVP